MLPPVKAFETGDMAAARTAQGHSRRLVQIMEQFGGQRVHKALMHVAGVPCGPNRLPLSTLTGSQLEALERALDDAGLMPFIRPG